MSAANVTAHTHQLSFKLARPQAAVWRAFTEDIAVWWPEDFYATPAPRRLVFEPRVGGRLYEDRGEGNGLLWYQVIALEAPQTLLLSGAVAPPFGGPFTSLLRLTFTAVGKSSTRFELTDSVFGLLGDPTNVAAGWKALFEEAFKRHVEGPPK